MVARDAPASPSRSQDLVTTDWLPAQVDKIRPGAQPAIPLITTADVRRVAPDLDVWDAWPVQLADGRVARFDGAGLWMGLAAPVMGDPNLRHRMARIRLLLERDERYVDLGDLLPDGFSPGQCEWSGSAIYRPETGRVELHFTATSRRGAPFRHEQRLFMTSADLSSDASSIAFGDWSEPVETVAQVSAWRRPADGDDPIPGFIQAFRDPAVFRDPKDGRDYLVYAATLTDGGPLHNGAIGVAACDGLGGWTDLGPLLRAPGLNHELERPHIIGHDGLYYLFWCTQKKMFAPGGPVGPTGLYGMVSEHVLGPYRPLNGSGLAAANPVSEPDQTYAWWVTGDLTVAGFIDQWGINGVDPADVAADLRVHFGGAIAPLFRLALQGDVCRVR